MSAWQLFTGDALVLAGTLVTTLGVLGIIRRPSTYVAIHATSLAVLGVLLVLGAAVVSGDWTMALRAGVVGLFFLFTSALNAHALARLARAEDEPGRDGGGR